MRVFGGSTSARLTQVEVARYPHDFVAPGQSALPSVPKRRQLAKVKYVPSVLSYSDAGPPAIHNCLRLR